MTRKKDGRFWWVRSLSGGLVLWRMYYSRTGRHADCFGYLEHAQIEAFRSPGARKWLAYRLRKARAEIRAKSFARSDGVQR